MSSPRRALAAALCLFGPACAPEAPAYGAKYTLPDLKVFVYGYDQLCQGVLDALPAENERLRHALGSPPGELITVAYGAEAVERFCLGDEPRAGCAARVGDKIQAVGGYGVLVHELAHAHRLARGVWHSPFIEEGLAEALQAGTMYSYQAFSGKSTDLAAALELERNELSQIQIRDAAHLVSFLIETRGEEAAIEALSHPDGAPAGLQETLGLSLSELSQQWTDAEDYIDRGTPCDHLPLLTLGEEGLSAELDLACDEAEVRGPKISDGAAAVWRTFCLDVARPTSATLKLDVDVGTAKLTLKEAQDDCPFSEAASGGDLNKFIDAGEVVEVEFSECLWRATIEAPLADAPIVSLRITPAPGD